MLGRGAALWRASLRQRLRTASVAAVAAWLRDVRKMR